MKISNLLINSIFAISSVLFFTSCSGDKKEAREITAPVSDEEAEKHEHEADVTRTEEGKPQFTVDEVFQKQLATLFGSYVSLKEAFVSSDAAKVKAEARKTLESLSKVDMKLVKDAAHNDWMIYQDEFKSALDKIMGSSDIEEQRKHFSKLSYSLYKTIKAYGLGGTTAYYEFCPMAFDDKGAYWLSDNSKIRNPYFGDKMLTCGSVQETLN